MGLLAFVLVPLAACAVADPDLATLTGPESWGGRKAHPAVVNPVTGQDPANVLSLRGEWEFYTTPEFGRSHPWTKYRWITDPKPWARTIRVPGCWEAQGVGEPGEGKCWNILGDNNAKALRHVYTFLDCELGIRWVEPGDRGIVFRRSSALTLPDRKDASYIYAFYRHPPRRERVEYPDNMVFGTVPSLSDDARARRLPDADAHRRGARG